MNIFQSRCWGLVTLPGGEFKIYPFQNCPHHKESLARSPKTHLLKKGQERFFTQDSKQGKPLVRRDGLPCEVQKTVAACSMAMS